MGARLRPGGFAAAVRRAGAVARPRRHSGAQRGRRRGVLPGRLLAGADGQAHCRMRTGLPSDRQQGHAGNPGQHPGKDGNVAGSMGHARSGRAGGRLHGGGLERPGGRSRGVCGVDGSRRGRRAAARQAVAAGGRGAQPGRNGLRLGHEVRRPHRRGRQRPARRNGQPARGRLHGRPFGRHPDHPRPGREQLPQPDRAVRVARHARQHAVVALLGRRAGVEAPVRAAQPGHGQRGARVVERHRQGGAAAEPGVLHVAGERVCAALSADQPQPPGAAAAGIGLRPGNRRVHVDRRRVHEPRPQPVRTGRLHVLRLQGRGVLD